MSVFFWSDTHFNHAGVIDYCGRPYTNVAEMNAALETRWNSVVGPRDTIWLLGDFGFHASEPLSEIFARLNGHKNLIIGNHDEKNPQVLRLPWERQERLFTFKQDGARIELCHYPLETWKGAQRGALMLHGHSHGSLKRVIPHRWDVGCDVWEFPVKLEEILALAEGQTFLAQDHHGD